MSLTAPSTDERPLPGDEDDSPARRRGRRLGLFVTIVASVSFVALLAYGLIASNPDRTIDDALARGSAAPEPFYRLAVLQRGELGPLESRLAPALADGWASQRELLGTPRVVNIWASWCVPCREEAPTLRRGWAEARPRGVAFVGVDMQDAPEDARAFLADFKVTYLNLRDPGNGVYRSFGATGIPETYFISRAGRVVEHVIGVVSLAQLRQGISAALDGRPRRAARGGAQRPAR